MKRILAVVTNQATYGRSDRPTGLWLGELVHFYDKAVKAGYEVDLTSPTGGEVPLDPRSVGRMSLDRTTRGYYGDPAFMETLNRTTAAADVDPDDYAAIFYTGGHGTMWDFPDDAALQRAARTVYANGGVVSSVCHGAAGLLNITLPDGSLLVSGRSVTGFATVEEYVARVKDHVPFLLEDELRKRGAMYTRARIPLTPYAVSDGRVVTGQNPYSTKLVADKVLTVLGSSSGA